MILASEKFDVSNVQNSQFINLYVQLLDYELGNRNTSVLNDIIIILKEFSEEQVLLQRNFHYYTGIPAYLRVLFKAYQVSHEEFFKKKLQICIDYLFAKNHLFKFDNPGLMTGQGSLLVVLLQIHTKEFNIVPNLEPLLEMVIKKVLIRSELIWSQKIRFIDYTSMDFGGLKGYSGLAFLLIYLGHYSQNSYLISRGNSLIEIENRIFNNERFSQIQCVNKEMQIKHTDNISWFNGALGMLLVRMKFFEFIEDRSIVFKLINYVIKHSKQITTLNDQIAIESIDQYLIRCKSLSIEKQSLERWKGVVKEKKSLFAKNSANQLQNIKNADEYFLFPSSNLARNINMSIPKNLLNWNAETARFFPLTILYPKTFNLLKRKLQHMEAPLEVNDGSVLKKFINFEVKDVAIKKELMETFNCEELINDFFEELPSAKQLFIQKANDQRKRLELLQLDDQGLKKHRFKKGAFFKIFVKDSQYYIARVEVSNLIKIEVRKCKGYEEFLSDLDGDFSADDVLFEINKKREHGEMSEKTESNLILLIRRLLLDGLIDPLKFPNDHYVTNPKVQVA